MEQKQEKIWFLHMLRGIAAVLVMIHHLGFMFWFSNTKVVDAFLFLLPRISSGNPFYYPVFALFTKSYFDLGAFGVALFFLISGFVIPISLQRGQYRGFLISRIFRIYPTYIIGFTITFAFIFVLSWFRGIGFSYNIKHYIAQILLVRDWLWLPSIDGISWTLETEMKFYLLLWTLAILGKLNSARIIGILALTLGLTNYFLHSQYASLLNDHVRIYQVVFVATYSATSLTFMLIGVCLYNSYSKKWSPIQACITTLATFFSFVIAFCFGPIQDLVETYAVSYTLALIVFLGVYFFQDLFKYNAVLDFLGDISYPLYIVHGVNGYILLTALDRLLINPYISIVITILMVTVLAYILHRFIEAPSNELGKKLALIVEKRQQ